MIINAQELKNFYTDKGYAPHEHIKEFFQDDTYEELRKNYPADELFKDEMPKSRKENQRPHHRRLMCFFKGQHQFFDKFNVGLDKLPKVWQELINLILDPVGEYQSWIRQTLKVKDISIRLDFHRTHSGSDVSPHLDTASKHGSHLFYFMPDGWEDEFGGTTVFYKDKTVPQMNPEPQDFKEYKTYPVKGNYSLLFKNTGNGWHGITPVKNNMGLQRQIFSAVIQQAK